MSKTQEEIDALVREAVGRGLEEWLADGREAYRTVIAAIPDFRELLVARVREQPVYGELVGVLDDAAQENNVILGLASLAKVVLPFVLAAAGA